MKDTDISAIKLGSAAFTRKWWEDRRSLFAHGSGTGKALDLWQKHCLKKIDQMSTSERVTAEETCNALRSSLLTAKKKVGSKDKATVKACDAYIGVLDEYANALNQAAQKSGGLFDAEQELVGQLLKFIPILQSTAKDCLSLEKLFEQKSTLYSKWEQEASKPMDPKATQERYKQIQAEELEISNEMKKFGKWNNVIISPWKELKGHIAARKLEDSQKIKAALRKANGEYDIYVDAMGQGQDLGQDHLHTLRRLIKQMEGKSESTQEVLDALNKLKTQLGDPSFGCGSKIFQQVDAVQEVLMGLKPLLHAVSAKQPLSPEQLEAVADLKTKVNQTDAIAKANQRAMLRLKSSVAAYSKSHGSVSECKTVLIDLINGIKKAEVDFAEHQKGLQQALKIISLVE